MWQEMARFSLKLVQYGLTHSRFGNISARVDDGLLITRSGSMLDELNEDSFVFCRLDHAGPFDPAASSETIVHRRIYLLTSALAVIHVHAPYAVALSILNAKDYLIPQDAESKHFLQRIPLVRGGIGSDELAANAAGALSRYNAIIARGHGTFAVGKTAEEAYVNTCLAEHACKILYLTGNRDQGLGIGEY